MVAVEVLLIVFFSTVSSESFCDCVFSYLLSSQPIRRKIACHRHCRQPFGGASELSWLSGSLLKLQHQRGNHPSFMTSVLRRSKNSVIILIINHQIIQYRFCMRINLKIILTAQVILYTNEWILCPFACASGLIKYNHIIISFIRHTNDIALNECEQRW